MVDDDQDRYEWVNVSSVVCVCACVRACDAFDSVVM